MDTVSLRDDPRSTVSALAAATRSLSIGGRDEVVHVFVTPQIRTEAEQLFQPGFAIGDNTLLIDAESEFDVWTHEYVHSRQEFPDTGRIRWLTEGSAEYYGWFLSVERGFDSWSSLRGVFVGATTDDSVLADPETWRGETEYNKGALVLGVLDHEIRVATDGERTLQDVLRRLNADTDPTFETFVKTVREVGGPDAAAAAEQYSTTSATPDYRPDENRLVKLYDGSSTGLNASLQTRTEIRSMTTAGTDGTHQFDPESADIQITPGQTVRIRGRITNVGDAGGLARLAVRKTSNGTTDRIKTPWVRWLRPQVTVTRNETLQFSRPETYETVWGDRRVVVRVAQDRGTASVIGVNATMNRSSERVIVEAVVRNNAALPTFVELPVSLDGQRLRILRTVVDGSATQTVTVPLNSSHQAPYTISIGDTQTTVGHQEGASRPETSSNIPFVLVLGVFGTLVLLAGVATWRIVFRR